MRVKAYNHILGQCGVGIFGGRELAAECRDLTLAQILERLPVLLPTTNTQARRALDQWFDTHDIRPNIVAELADSALLKVFGQAGHGLFPAPLAIRRDIELQYSVELVAPIPDVVERYYAISVERRLKHPAVLAISNAARGHSWTDEPAGPRRTND